MRRPGVAMQISTPTVGYEQNVRNSQNPNSPHQPTTPTSLKVSNLWAFGCAAVHAGALDAGGLAIVVGNLLDLLSQLSGGCKDQTLRTEEDEGERDK